jgi:hypothetical protein
MSALWNLDEVVLFFATVAAFVVAIEICFRIGRRHGRGEDDALKSHFAALQAALLGLLALLLGFNFAMAASRFDARKALIQDEVNTIRTTWLRARLLPVTHAPKFEELVRSYVAARIEFMRAGVDEALLAAASAEASYLEEQLWVRTTSMVREDSAPPKAWFVQALNEMIVVNDKRRAALDNHVPHLVLDLLFTVGLGAMGFIGYGSGLAGRRRHVSTAIFAVLIALVFATIVDLDRPRTGFIRVGEDRMLELKAALDRNAP